MFKSSVIFAFAVCLAGTVPAQESLERLEEKIEELPEPAKRSEPPVMGLRVDEARGGVRIVAITVGGPAAAAGLAPGDLITSISGLPTDSFDAMSAALRGRAAGDTIEVAYRRGIRRGVATLKLAGRGTAPASDGPKLGVIVSPITDESRKRLELTVARGAVIDRVQPDSPAARAELPVGAAIVAIDGRVVESPDDLVALVRNLRPGQEIEVGYYLRDQQFRKTVSMAGSSAPAEDEAAAADEAPPIDETGADATGADEPGDSALEKLESTLKPPIDKPGSAPRDEITAIKREMQALQARLDQLQRRLTELERSVGDE